jgi:hypothetical protein
MNLLSKEKITCSFNFDKWNNTLLIEVRKSSQIKDEIKNNMTKDQQKSLYADLYDMFEDKTDMTSLRIQLLHKQLEAPIMHDLECLELKDTKDNKYHYNLLRKNLIDMFNGVCRPIERDIKK